MQVKSVLAGMLALGMAAGIGAEESRTVFQEEFDRYGFDLPRFSDACSIAEAPASLKSLEVRPQTNGEITVYKEIRALPAGVNPTDFDFAFKFRPQREAERAFNVLLYFSPDPNQPGKGRRALRLVVTDAGSSIAPSGLPPSPIGRVQVTPREYLLPPIPDNTWTRVLVKARGRNLSLFVEREGTLVREASAEGWGEPLTGFNFSTRHALDLDAIVIQSVSGVSRDDFRAQGGERIATHDVVVPLADGDRPPRVSFAAKPNFIAAPMVLTFTTEAGENLVYTLKPFAASAKINVRRDVTELVDGKLVTTQKIIAETRLLPDAGYTLSGRNVRGHHVTTTGSMPIHVRPNPARYLPQEVARLVAAWERTPGASATALQVALERDGAGYALWIDGHYVMKIEDSSEARSPIKSASLALPAGASLQGPVNEDRRPAWEGLRYPLVLAHARHSAGPLAGAKLPFDGDRVVDGVPFRGVDAAHALDTGLCRENLGSHALECDGFLQRSAFDGMPDALLFQVPPAIYPRAFALCAVAPDPGKDAQVTARLTKYLANGGRTPKAIADCTVTLPLRAGEPLPPNVRQVGEIEQDGIRLPLYLVEFVFEAGKILDILVLEKNPWIHFEILGGKYLEKDNFYLSRADKPSETPSGVQVFAVTLEKSPVHFVPAPGRFTNVYYPDERAFMNLALTADAPGTYPLRWTIAGIDGQPVDAGLRQVAFAKPGETVAFDVDLRAKPLPFGWYGVTFTLADAAGRVFLEHPAAFSLLPADTRQAGYESPYYAWNFAGSHGSPREMEVIGDILKREGVRRTMFSAGVCAKMNEQDAAPWKLTYGQFPYLRPSRVKGNTPEEKQAETERLIREYVARFPHCGMAIIFHESGGGPVPLELVGGTTALTEEDLRRQKQRVADALEAAQAWRRYAPGVRLVVGNSGSSLGLIAQLFRENYPADMIDAMGEESVGMSIPPEISVAQQNWMLKKLADLYGYTCPPEACFEWKCYADRLRPDPRRGNTLKARAALIAHAWKFKLIPIGGFCEHNNSYWNTVWSGGYFERAPLFYPRPAFNAAATLTQVLDSSRFARLVATGSKTVYALEFRRGAEAIFALWTPRGETTVTLDATAGARIRQTTAFGAESDLAGRVIGVGEDPLYLTTAAGAIKGFAAGRQRTFRHESYPGSDEAAVAAPMDKVADWTLVAGADPRLGNIPGELPIRRPGDFTLMEVRDEEKGACLELALAVKTGMPELVRDCTLMRLAAPVEVKGRPGTVAVWVKGNSSWGKLHFEIRDAEGETWMSANTAGYGCEVYDWPCLTAFNYDGWHLLSFPLTKGSPVKIASPGENEWQWVHDGTGDRRITYPITITGLAVEMPAKTLNLLEMEDVPPVIRLKDLCTYCEIRVADVTRDAPVDGNGPSTGRTYQ